MRWMDGWLDKVGRLSGWLSLILILPTVLLLLLAADAPDFPYSWVCPEADVPGFGQDPECIEDVDRWFVPLQVAIGILFLAFWPVATTWLSIRLHALRRRRLQRRFEPRLQSAKDWFVRGDIDEAQFERLRSPLEKLVGSGIPSERRLLAGQVLARFGALLLGVGLTAAAMAISYVPELGSDEGWWYYGILVPGATLGVILGSLLLAAGLPLRVSGVRGTAALVAEAETAEEAVLATARTRLARPRTRP